MRTITGKIDGKVVSPAIHMNGHRWRLMQFANGALAYEVCRNCGLLRRMDATDSLCESTFAAVHNWRMR